MAGGSEVRISYVIGRLDRAVRAGIEEAIAPHGLTVPQLTALSVLARRAGLSNAQLARRSYVTQQSMHRVILELERRGLVKRNIDPSHRRILRTTLTRRGQRELERCEASVAEMEQRMLSALDEERRTHLLHDLAACVRALGAGLSGLE